MTGFAKSVILRLDYTNYHAWRQEVVRNLKIANCSHHICKDNGIADELEALMYVEPMPPPEMTSNGDSAIVSTSAAAAAANLRSQYQYDLAAWQHGNDLRKKQRLYDGVSA